MPLYPITFSIPETKIVDTIPEKKRILSPLIPGDLSTYIYETENEYYDQYKESMFAITTKKRGWDCLRHYEILACGTLPVFLDIDMCPPNTMALWRKDLLEKSYILYNKIKKYNIDTIPDYLKTEYYELLNDLMQHLRLHLTTKSMAKYVLSKTDETAKNILYLSGCVYPDYLRCLTLAGLKELLGANCHDYLKIHHIYDDCKIKAQHLYGNGFTYSKIISAQHHIHITEQEILDNINNHKYDLIIYGHYHRGMPFYDVICKEYTTDKIIIFCGDDIHICNQLNELLNAGHPVFKREA